MKAAELAEHSVVAKGTRRVGSTVCRLAVDLDCMKADSKVVLKGCHSDEWWGPTKVAPRVGRMAAQ